MMMRPHPHPDDGDLMMGAYLVDEVGGEPPHPHHAGGAAQCRLQHRRPYFRFTGHQKERLEQYFLEVTHYPDLEQRQCLSVDLDAPEQRVRVWFENRRRLARRELKSEGLKVPSTLWSCGSRKGPVRLPEDVAPVEDFLAARPSLQDTMDQQQQQQQDQVGEEGEERPLSLDLDLDKVQKVLRRGVCRAATDPSIRAKRSGAPSHGAESPLRKRRNSVAVSGHSHHPSTIFLRYEENGVQGEGMEDEGQQQQHQHQHQHQHQQQQQQQLHSSLVAGDQQEQYHLHVAGSVNGYDTSSSSSSSLCVPPSQSLSGPCHSPLFFQKWIEYLLAIPWAPVPPDMLMASDSGCGGRNRFEAILDASGLTASDIADMIHSMPPMPEFPHPIPPDLEAEKDPYVRQFHLTNIMRAAVLTPFIQQPAFLAPQTAPPSPSHALLPPPPPCLSPEEERSAAEN